MGIIQQQNRGRRSARIDADGNGIETDGNEIETRGGSITRAPMTRADDRHDWEVKRDELENYIAEPGKIKMLIHDDVIYQILLWLPVISVLRFKLVCRQWRVLIESSYFIKQHLHLHHYDPVLKDKDHNLVYLLPVKNSRITFALTSIEGFEVPNVCLQLKLPDLHGNFRVKVLEIVSYNGIICLNLLNGKNEQSICLWNPATKQSRVLPQSPFFGNTPPSVGFGFDIKSNDYKVVNIFKGYYPIEMRAEVYSLNTRAWRSITSVFPNHRFIDNPRMPFNNGTCFFWSGHTSLICFDFSSEMFRSISFSDGPRYLQHTSVVCDKILGVLTTRDDQTEIWVFNGYGTVNESWTKLYTIDTYSICWGMPFIVDSMNGNYIFFTRMKMMCRFNVVTKETDSCLLKKMSCSFGKTLVEFKESLVSIEEENSPICINKDSGNQLMLEG